MPSYLVTSPEFLTADQIRAIEIHAQKIGREVRIEYVKPRLEIIGRRWFRKAHGNTYHSAEVVVNGYSVGRVDFAYGYGSQYVETALSIIRRASIPGVTLAPGDTDSIRTLEAVFDVVCTVEDVKRKADL